MKRYVHGSSFFSSPFLSLALFIMLLLVSLNYWATSEQNKDLHERNQKNQRANDHIQEKLIDVNHKLKQAEKKQEELKKSEAELEKCFNEKMEINLVKSSNISSPRIDDLVEKVASYQEQNEKLKIEIGKIKEEMELKDARSVELGRRLKQLRDQLNNDRQNDILDVLKTTGQEEPGINATKNLNQTNFLVSPSQMSKLNVTTISDQRKILQPPVTKDKEDQQSNSSNDEPKNNTLENEEDT
eukprot:GFUD01013356.1.p1 GENE.GFUD01013356.1~~GFUD01013356.1.p1  ORF type:complete len:242 (+),score=92.15 GFUD01013356.1:82-807(+)